MLSGSEQFEKDANQFIEEFIRNTESAMSDEAFKNRLTQELLVNMKELISKVEPGVDKRFHIKTVQVDQLLEYGGEVLLHDLSGMGFKIGKSSARQKKSTVLPKRFIDPKGGINYKTVQDLIIADLENKNMHDYENQEMVINNMRVIEKPAVKRYTQLTSTAAVVSPNYGVKFKSGQESLADANAPTNEINIFYMGTGGTIHVGGKHKDVYEGGDVLCHLGLHKGIEQKQPTLLIRGIGTNDDFKTATAYYAKEAKDANTSGYVSETVLAYGLNQRLTVTMEQFFIPTLLQIISKKSSNDELPCDLTFNVTGHSRGAITSYAMVDLIDAWMNEVENMNDKDIDLMVKQIAMEFSDATKSKTFD